LTEQKRKKHKSVEEIQVDKARSHIVLTRIDDGVYGVRVNESTMEVIRGSDGSFRIVPRDADTEPAQSQNLRNRLIHSLRNSVELFAGRIVKEVVGLVRDIVSIATRALVGLLVLFMVAGFLLLDYDRIADWFSSRVPVKYRSDYSELCGRLNAGLSGVIRGQLIICVVNGILSGIGFLIFIPEYALTFAVFAGVMSIIPIFGTIISTLPAVLIGMTVSWGTALAVFLWILGIHALEANLLNPKIIAKQAMLSPVLVVFALVAGEASFGIVGALLAVPVLSVLHSFMSFLFVRIRPQIIEPS
jgi:predicted PurR-regulated permease PerM